MPDSSHSQNNPSSSSTFEFEISPEASVISNELTERIKIKIIEKDAPIRFETFMQMALYEPRLGYYQNNLHKFGEKGDFITAPEMGGLFAECMADSILDSLKSTEKNTILEIGAGSGRLAVNLIQSLKKLENLPSQYFILEPSATLQSQQKQLIKQECADFLDNVIWLTELPTEFEGVIIANEVIDAIPCQIVEKTEDGWFYLGVDLVDGHLCSCLTDRVIADDLPHLLAEESNNNTYLVGYQTEIRRLTSGWLGTLSTCLANGHILLIDYGYPANELYHLQRNQGSLTCFINHHKHSDYLKAIGLQDITAHVDFTDVAIKANEHDLDVTGFTTQAGYLLENGIIQKAEALLETSEASNLDTERYKISQQVQKLMMPGQMGEVLKVMSLSRVKNTETPLKGFSMQDHLHRL